MGIAVDSDDNLYVVDHFNDRVQQFDSAGTFVTKWGTSGNGNGEFDGPVGIAVDNSDHVYVSDHHDLLKKPLLLEIQDLTPLRNVGSMGKGGILNGKNDFADPC